MKKFLLPCLILFLAILNSCRDKISEATLYDLTCENLTNPDGIGTQEPGLSWKIASGSNGTRQKAYQILAASDIRLLNEKDADLWNTGKVMSISQILVPWSGKQLSSRSSCVWKVRIWDEHNGISDWSAPATFSVGLISEKEWKASYIGFGVKNEKSVSPQFFKSFEISEKPEKVFLYINSLGYHEVYLNGNKIGNLVLAPAVAQFSKRSQVLAYDITDNVIQGKNVIVIWAGRGWYAPGLPGVVFDGPVVRAQVDALKNREWATLAGTDTTWKARNSGYYTLGTWQPGQFGGEEADATLLLPDLSAESLESAEWQPVTKVNIPEHKATAQLTEGNIIMDTLKAVSVSPAGKNIWLADIGTTLTGLAEIKFEKLTKGQKIKLQFCDHLDKDGKPVDQGQEDIYTASGKPGESFRNRFNYHGYRYITISSLDYKPATEDISAYPLRTGYKLASTFECSDEDMNRIHDMLFYTLQCLSPGGYLVDCPQIERLGYGGDGNASTETAQTMFDLAPLYRNWLQAWGDCNREDGGMPHTAPNPYRAGGGPYWCGFIITASWRTYMNYGDKRILEKYYPVMQNWLRYAEKYSPVGLLEGWPETDYRSWYLGDWASPEGTDHTNPKSIRLVNNCFMVVCYETMNKIAMNIGKPDDAFTYANRKKELIHLINKELYDSSTGIYGSGIQIDMTYPLLAGVVPDTLKEKVTARLRDVILKEHDGHIACGLVGIPVFTEWCERNGESELLYSMLKKRDYPGYLYMIDNGATSTWEHWNGARSRIHNCYNGIGSWFYQSLAGIRKDDNEAGYRSFIIQPDIPEGITWTKATKETPYGIIRSDWKKENGTFDINLEIPAGTTARVMLPENTKEYVLNTLKKRGKSSQVILQSGKYHLTYNLNY
jgi:alpha-L-rhamnosidase